jgi:DHA1 family purine ribonucleoside efflux pump-like MFS transporter
MTTYHPAPSPAHTRGGARSWAPIAALSFGIATLVGSEFLPASVLPAIAADIGVREGVAGLAVAMTAVAGAVTAPTIAVVLPRADRRVVLLGLLALATLSNLAVAVTPNFALLLIARLVLGVAIAGYWSFAFGAGVTARPGRDHVVSTALFVGVSVATIVVVPLSSLAGDAIGWRAVFLGAAGVSALSLAAVAATLPQVPAHPSAGLTMMRRAVANRLLMAGVGCIVLFVFGNFVAYPYIRLAIDDVAPDRAAWLLLAWGVGGLAGNLVAGALSARLRLLATVGPVLLGGGLALSAGTATVAVFAVAIVVWGIGFNLTTVVSQLWVTRVEPEHAESAMALQVTAFQSAITLAAVVGGALVDAYDVQVALLVGAASAVASGIGFALLRVPRD